MDDFLAQFLIEARELITGAVDDIAALRRDPNNREHLDDAFRVFHTLKGSVALFDMAPAGQILHAAEDLLDQARRKALSLDDSALTALLACIDRIDAWVDAMETLGRLPDTAATEVQALLASLGRSSTVTDLSAGDAADWLPALLARGFDTAGLAAGLTAFRYEPDSDCFFRGDDPLAIVAGVPKLAAIKVMATDAWPPLEDLEPFRCTLVVEGLAEAGVEEVHSAFRLVRNQVRIAAVPPASPQGSDAAAAARSLRIATERIDGLADNVGELVAAGNALAPLVAEASQLDGSFAARLREVQASLARRIENIRNSVLAIRMVPIGPAVRRLPRLVREIAAVQGRQVDFTIEGEQVECDKAVADALYEPLLHLVRNALDHGIETPDRRAAAGKPPWGKLRLRFFRAGDQLVTELEDDGAGIDPSRIRRIAVERQLLSREEAEALSDDAARAMIFTAGFSTADRVSDISGRGVGMDAVKAGLDPLGGRIELESRIGQGTTIRIALPLSAITTRMLVVEAGQQRYAVPFESVAETVIVPSERILPLGDHEAIVLRDRTVPVVHLRELLGEKPLQSTQTKLMVAHAGNDRVAIAVDGFGERIEAMVRPASGLLAGLVGVGGTTLLGSGDVMLVLDVESLVA